MLLVGHADREEPPGAIVQGLCERGEGGALEAWLDDDEIRPERY
jgi:hypothetical protein